MLLHAGLIFTLVQPIFITVPLIYLHPQNIPFYVFSESYGGKMAAAFGLKLFDVRCSFMRYSQCIM